MAGMDRFCFSVVSSMPSMLHMGHVVVEFARQAA